MASSVSGIHEQVMSAECLSVVCGMSRAVAKSLAVSRIAWRCEVGLSGWLRERSRGDGLPQFVHRTSYSHRTQHRSTIFSTTTPYGSCQRGGRMKLLFRYGICTLRASFAQICGIQFSSAWNHNTFDGRQMLTLQLGGTVLFACP